MKYKIERYSRSAGEWVSSSANDEQQQKPFTRKEAIKWATDMGDAYMPYRVVDVRANPIIFQSGEVKNV